MKVPWIEHKTNDEMLQMVETERENNHNGHRQKLTVEMARSHPEYYVPSISCCTPFFLVLFCIHILSCCTLHLQLHVFCFFFSLCVYMSCHNIVITMGGQLRQAQASLTTCHLLYCCIVLVTNPSSSSPAINKLRRLLPAISVTTQVSKPTFSTNPSHLRLSFFHVLSFFFS